MIKNGLKLPDFIIGGAARCGTTTLYELLKNIDKIYLPPNKRPEPHFFLKSWEFKKGLKYYSIRYFKNAKDYQLIGECSTSYLYRYDLADIIKKYLGNIKWIFILRNPLDRLISQYFFNINNRIEYNDINFAIRYEKERVESTILHWKEIAPFDYTGRSLYSKGIKRYIEVFGRDNVLVIIFDEFINNAKKIIKNILEFLGIKDENTNNIINKIPKKPPNLNVEQQLFEVKLDDDVKKKLYNLFYKDISELEKVIGKDLSFWKNSLDIKLKIF